MITKLRPDEAVRLDHDRLEHLYMQLGPSGAEGVVARAMEELAARLSKVERLYKRGELGEMQRAARSMIAISEQIGMVTFARVAEDVTRLSDSENSAALAATVGRLIRIGEGSLMAVWDLQDASI
ncbi:MAG: hypothetical protein ACRBBK_05840 [Paracoccaceae bacterium]